jgi:uncharacterized protein YecT (DUF1311 family)
MKTHQVKSSSILVRTIPANLGPAMSLMLLTISLTGCQNNGSTEMDGYQHYDYTNAFIKCIPTDLKDKTLAEHEHDCASSQYKARKEELNRLYSEVSAAYEQRAKDQPSTITQKQFDKLQTSQQRFLKFLKNNSKLSNAAFMSSYPYNYYGTMTDYINVRIRHLNNLKRELGNE